MEPMSADEERIIRSAKRGDPRAIEWLVERYQTPVFNLAYRLMGDAAEAEDAAQETFVRAYRQLHTYDVERRFSTWLLSITSHYCIDRLRRRKRSGPSLDDEGWGESLAVDQPEPDEKLIERERAEEVQELLGTLPDGYRTVIALKYWSDLPVETISRLTGDSVANVKVKLYRARQALAKALRKRRAQAEAIHAR